MLGVANVALRAAGWAFVKPSANPISRWELDETSSAEGVFEDRGPAHVLMVHAGTWADLTTDPLVEGDDGTSAYTDGSAYATIPANVAAHDLAGLTISFYYQRASAAAKQILLAAGEAGVHQAGDFSIEVLANGGLRAWHIGQDGVLRFFESTNGVTGTNLQVGTAHRIDLSLGSQGARIYLDGAELTAAAIPDNTNGWNNGRVKYLGRWVDGIQAPAVGVFDCLRIWNRQLTSAEIADLEPAQSVTLPQPEPGPDPEPGQGISIPAFEYQTITDSVPAGAVWWDPTNGDDGDDGSAKGLAKKTFGGAQNAIGAGGTIVVAGGRHTVPELVFTKSGTSGNRLKLFAEPGAEVVLYRESEFAGALEKTWTWTLIDAERGIWQSPSIGSLPKTIVNNSSGNGNVSNGLWGFMRLPNGAYGRPHLMRLLWYDLEGDYEPNAFHSPNTGGNAGRFIKNGGYGGPGLYAHGDGRVRIRMQKVTSAYSGAEWPTDGRFGTCVGSNGVWQEPISEDPNDYEIHITRWAGDFGGDGPALFNLNGQGWWHIKGINGALMQIAVNFTTGSENNWFENCTWYPQGIGAQYLGTTRNNKFTRCMFLSGDLRSLAWREYKTSNYWCQHARTAGLYGRGNLNANTAAGTIVEHCTFFGWFDLALSLHSMNSTIILDHCAILNTVDDGLMQNNTSGDWSFDAYYCYLAGGPCWSGSGDGGAGSRDNYWHHCVIDLRYSPMLWCPIGETDSAKRGVKPQRTFPTHNTGSTGTVYIRKMWNCTFIGSPDTPVASILIQGPSPNSHNVPAGRQHEVYNCIFAVIDNKRYPLQSRSDCVAFHLSCQRSTAGVHRYDYNCYFRDVPSSIDPIFKEIQNSLNASAANYTSLADFRGSAHKTTSESMYASGTGGLAAAIGIDGHEEHGVQVDPGFVDLANRDYRPTHASVTSGAIDVSASGWPAATDPHSWKGALDPNGSGTEVGPHMSS
jgi:Concanavalin A-like lectin/glucanases superfamily